MDWLACYSAPTPPEAHVVKGFLEGRGGPCLLRAEGSSVYPSTAFGSRVHVLVPEDWLPVAKKMVERRRRAEPGRVVPLRPRRRVGWPGASGSVHASAGRRAPACAARP